MNRALLTLVAGTIMLAGGLIVSPAYAAADAPIQVSSSVDCSSEYPSGILITNPIGNQKSYFLQSEISDSSGAAQFGDGGLLAPGESVRVASGSGTVTVEDATYTYRVQQSEQVGDSSVPTEPFVNAADGTYVFDCATTPEYYLTKYDGTIWAVNSADIRAITYEEWSAAGFPSPRPAPTDFVKYPWSSTISAVTFFGTPESRWVWKHVSFDEWTRAGRP